MRHLAILTILLVLTVSGCTSLKGTMLDGRACTFWTQADLVGAAGNIVQQYPEGTDRQKVENALAYAQAAKLTGTAFCEMLRAIEGQPAGDAAKISQALTGWHTRVQTAKY